MSTEQSSLNEQTRTAVEQVADATASLLASARGLSDEQWAAPSGLPGWSRAHVLAHLALNAEALNAALLTVGNPQPRTLYSSDEDRDRDIDQLRAAGPNQILGRLTHGAGELERTFDLLPIEGTVERVPGGWSFPANNAVFMRWGEVEIHHADLDVGYEAGDWSDSFTAHIFARLLAERGEVADATLSCDDEEFHLGGGGPRIAGSKADLAWWLLGRGDGAALTGDLPELGRWR